MRLVEKAIQSNRAKLKEIGVESLTRFVKTASYPDLAMFAAWGLWDLPVLTCQLEMGEGRDITDRDAGHFIRLRQLLLDAVQREKFEPIEINSLGQVLDLVLSTGPIYQYYMNYDEDL